jgi:hypothetical protein
LRVFTLASFVARNRPARNNDLLNIFCSALSYFGTIADQPLSLITDGTFTLAWQAAGHPEHLPRSMQMRRPHTARVGSFERCEASLVF